MRKTEEFTIFGVEYKTTQFSAAEGGALLGRASTAYPTELLKHTLAKKDGQWVSLTTRANINDNVRDVVEGGLTKVQALDCLLSVVREFNFGFLDEWSPIRVPTRFLSEAKTVSAKNSEPITSSLITDGYATMKELEEYYSLEDAFQMFDILMAKTVNEALSQEAAEAEARRKSR